MTKKELIEALEVYPDDQMVLLEANESGYAFSSINSIKKIDVDFEHSDDNIEEIECIILSEM